MGRKKKIEQPKKVETSTIKYKGSVSINVLKNGKVVRTLSNHNKGNYPLFKYIAQCLVANFSEPEHPCYLKLGNSTTSEGVTTFKNYSLSPQRYASAKPILSNNSAIASFEFLVPATTLALSNNLSINTLRLYNDVNRNADELYSAELILSSGNEISGLTEEMTLQVIWNMSFESVTV